MNELGFLWQPCRNGARLLRVYGDTPCPVLPARLEGAALAEVGPYCFSQRQPGVPQGARRTGPAGPGAHAICGWFVERVTLPDTVTTLDSAAFYDCRSLEELTFGAALSGLGSDLFTNCTALKTLTLRASPAAPTGLRRVVGSIAQDITVHFLWEGAVQTELFYPEYSEYLDENTPAHIFNRSIEGVGYRLRQCFAGEVLRFDEYDAAFAACTGESAGTLCRMALGRLRRPYGLAPRAAAIYRAYLAAHGTEAAALAVRARDAAMLAYLSGGLLPAAALAEAAALAARAGWSEGAALALRAKKPAGRRYTFDDL